MKLIHVFVFCLLACGLSPSERHVLEDFKKAFPNTRNHKVHSIFIEVVVEEYCIDYQKKRTRGVFRRCAFYEEKGIGVKELVNYGEETKVF